MDILKIYNRLAGLPGGRRLFSWLVCWKRAPIFRSISPLFTELKPGLSAARIKNRRKVRKSSANRACHCHV